jgi:hypothetical protein
VCFGANASEILAAKLQSPIRSGTMGRARHLTDAEKREIFALRRSKMTYEKISVAMGCSTSAVGKVAKSAGKPKVAIQARENEKSGLSNPTPNCPRGCKRQWKR